jgi:hypothetical protein
MRSDLKNGILGQSTRAVGQSAPGGFEIAASENRVGVLEDKGEINDGGDSKRITPRALG